jgi:hypothetical protein
MAIVKRVAIGAALILALAGCTKQQVPNASTSSSSSTAPVSGPFTDQELPQFAALNPIDTHTHAFQNAPELYTMLKRLNLHTLDITLVDDFGPELKDLAKTRKEAWTVVHHSDGYIAMCSTFDPFKYNQPNFAADQNRGINQDFAQGAVAVKCRHGDQRRERELHHARQSRF